VNFSSTTSARGPRRSSPWRRAAKWALRLAGAALALQHLVLLARRIADASIGEPAVLVRWLGAAATVAAALAIRRRGGRLFEGRTGLAFALVVLLLHVGSLPVDAASGFVLPAGLALLLTSGFAAARISSASPAPAMLPARQRRRRTLRPPVTSPGYGRLFASRPPPRLASPFA
jgi:hypothetical protein